MLFRSAWIRRDYASSGSTAHTTTWASTTFEVTRWPAPDGLTEDRIGQNRRAAGTRSSRPVDVAPVGDRDDRDDAVLVVDRTDHAERTPPRAVQSLEVEPKGSAYPMRVLGQAPVDELDTGRCDLLREAIE